MSDITKEDMTIINYGVIKFHPKDDIEYRLHQAYRASKQLCKQYKPTVLGVENVFVYLGSLASFALQGSKTAVIIGFLEEFLEENPSLGYPNIHKLSTTSIKKQIVGKGRATKDEVAAAVKAKTGMDVDGVPSDATDAVAVSWCTHRLIKQQAQNAPQ